MLVRRSKERWLKREVSLMKKSGGLMAVDKTRERERLDVGVCMSRYHDLKKKRRERDKVVK